MHGEGDEHDSPLGMAERWLSVVVEETEELEETEEVDGVGVEEAVM